MKSYCIRCKERIANLDFYMETKHGRICSSCLVKLQKEHDPGEQIQSLFKDSIRPGQGRSEAEKQADKLKVMSTRQLRFSLP